MRTKLTDLNSIPKVIADMTLEEKVGMLTQEKSSTSLAIPDMDIPALMYDDGLAGVNAAQLFMHFLSDCEPLKEDGTVDKEKTFYYLQQIFTILDASPEEIRAKYAGDAYMNQMVDYFESKLPDGKDFMSFPSGINVGATFNVEMAEKIGKTLGIEMRASGIDVCYGPNVDIMRNPLGGRNYEMFSEDTYHASRMSVAYINGFQSVGSAACAKHFIANNVETNRNAVNEIISKRVLREVYSQSFEAAVKESKVKTVMSAYNAVNGCFSSYNKSTLTDMLKEDWGFEGYVVSDWGAASDNKHLSIGAGLDMITKGPNDMTEVYRAIEDGTLSMERVDDAIARILRVIVELREERARVPLEFDREKMLDTAYETLVDGTVLLKNKDDVLPLAKDEKVAFFGKFTKELFEFGSGSTFINTRIHTNVFDESAKIDSNIIYEDWNDSNVAVYTAAAISGEGADRPNMYLEDEDRIRLPKVLKEAKRRGMKTVVILNIAQPVDMREWIDDADAIFAIFVPGCMGGKAAAHVLYGLAEPGGRLPATFPIRFEDTPCYPYFPGEGTEMMYGEGVFVGYKNYDIRNMSVQFPFGFGLSYTTFESTVDNRDLYMDLENQPQIQIPVTVTNTGKRSGSEVIQLYLKDKNPEVLKPKKELKAFVKVFLKAGETKVVNLVLDKEAFRVFDEAANCWKRPAGEYQLLIGTSCADEDIFAAIDLHVTNNEKVKLGAFSPVKDIAANDEAMAILRKYLPMIDDFISNSPNGDSTMSKTPIGKMLPMLLNIGIPDAVKAAGVAKAIYEELEVL